MREAIDCIIIGYNELPVQAEVRNAYEMRGQSAHLYSLLTNTIGSGSDRMTYLDFLNRAAEQELGHNPLLHVSEMPNLGVTYLRNFMQSAGLAVESINFLNFERDRLVELLRLYNVTSVAITTTFYTNDTAIRDIIRFVKDNSPSTRIIVGGPHILNICSYYSKDVLDYALRIIGADYYIFDSQGEGTLARLVRALATSGEAIEAIPNLFIQSDGIKSTPRIPENNNLEAARIDWAALPPQLVRPTVMTRTARSCAFKCSFCTYPILAGDLTVMGVEAVEHQLRELERLGAQNVAIIDDTFNVPLERFKALCRMMIRNRFSFRWFSYLRCGNIDVEGLDLLAESGCAGVFLGIESGDPEVLKNMNKKAVANKYRDGIIGLRERGVATYASIIVGFPGETVESVRRTTQLLQEAKPTFFHPELYCHYQFAPVSARAAEFELTGTGYSWSHKTMDWRQAQACLIEMVESVTESIYMPTYSFDFWALPYLRGRGLSTDFIQSFLKICNRAMLKGVADDTPDVSLEEADLRALVRASWPGAWAKASAHPQPALA